MAAVLLVVGICSTAASAVDGPATPPVPGVIEGVVTDDLGIPLPNMCVAGVAVTAAAGPLFATTTSTGFYRMTPPASGDYTVNFHDCGRREYVPEFYDDAYDYYTAKPVAVEQNTVTVVNEDLQRAGSVSGVVTSDDGQPIGSVCVSVSGSGGHDSYWNAPAMTTSTGYYVARGVRPGPNKVQFHDCSPEGRYLGEYYDDQDFRSLASSVDVQPTMTTAGIDASLAKAGRVTGVVTDPAGQPVNFACVEARKIDGTYMGMTYTTATGYYSLGRLKSGDLKLMYRQCGTSSPALAFEWFNDTSSFADASPVPVTQGSDSIANVQLDLPGSITGVVTSDPPVAPNNGPYLCISAYSGDDVVGWGYTTSTGYYSISGLRGGGSYDLRFGGCGFGEWAPEWYNDAPSRETALPVSVTSGASTGNVNATVTPGGSISGVVTGPSGPVGGVCISVHEGESSSTAAWGFTTETGYYRVGGLTSGAHDVHFVDCRGRDLASQWWDGQAFRSNADSVSVVAGSETAGISPRLEAAARIRGTATEADGDAIAGVCVDTEPSDPSVWGYTSVTGAYTIDRLPGGTYSVVFDDCGLGYNDVAYPSPVTASPGGITSGINAVMALGVAGPGSVTASPANGQATVSWTDPTPFPDRPIAGFIVSAGPSGPSKLVAGSERSTVMSGLANGSMHTFSVRTLFADGRGGSTFSAPVRIGGRPSAPRNVSALAGNSTAAISWSAPSTDGGLPITEYVVTASPGGMSTAVTTTSAVLSGLTNGTSYAFTVVARNSAGDSGGAVSNAVVPEASGGDGLDLGVEEAGATAAGTQTLVQGSGFGPYEEVTIELHSTPILLKRVLTDGVGAFSAVVTIPAGATPGRHTIVATGRTATGDVLELRSPVIVVADVASTGYWLVAGDGGVFSYGGTDFHGSTGAMTLNKPIVGMASTPTGDGYWAVASDGGIFAFGDAEFFGSTGAMTLNKPIVGMASTPTGEGYWLVASDGGIFAFGDADFFGSTGAMTLNKPIVGMASTPTGDGYWMVASDGGVFSFGDAGFQGSTGSIALNSPIVGMAPSPTGRGYWMVAADGGVFTFGDAPFLGSRSGTGLAPYVGLRPTASGKGYRMVDSAGRVAVFGDARFFGDASTVALSKPMLGLAP